MVEQQTIENRVIALYRVSDKQQVDKNDIPMQKERCREFIQDKGWNLIDELYEKGISGFKVPAKDRDAIQELQRRAVNKEFDILLVFMFDRVGRKDDETPFIVEWFVRNGVQVWSAEEGQQRFDSHVDKLMNYIRFWQASGESLKTSIRVKVKFEQMTREGIYHGGGAPYGYQLIRNGRTNKRNREIYDIAIEPLEAEIVKAIFTMYAREGYGAQRLANHFNNQGIRKRGKDFSNTAIQRMLTNVIYIGILTSGEIRSDPIPALRIIDDELFQQAQEVRVKRTNPHSNIPYSTKGVALLKSIVYCGNCGAKMNISTGGHSASRYRCYTNARYPHRCNGLTTISCDKLDSIVVEIVRRMFRDIKTLSHTDVKQKQMEQFMLLKSEQQRDARGRAEAKQTELEDMKGEAKAVDKQNKQYFTLAEMFSTCSNEAQNMILHQLIQSVRIYPTK